MYHEHKKALAFSKNKTINQFVEDTAHALGYGLMRGAKIRETGEKYTSTPEGKRIIQGLIADYNYRDNIGVNGDKSYYVVTIPRDMMTYPPAVMAMASKTRKEAPGRSFLPAAWSIPCFGGMIPTGGPNAAVWAKVADLYVVRMASFNYMTSARFSPKKVKMTNLIEIARQFLDIAQAASNVYTLEQKEAYIIRYSNFGPIDAANVRDRQMFASIVDGAVVLEGEALRRAEETVEELKRFVKNSVKK